MGGGMTCPAVCLPGGACSGGERAGEVAHALPSNVPPVLLETPQHVRKAEVRAPAGTAPHSPGLENRYNACSCTMSAHAGGSVPVSELLATASEVSCTKVLHAGGSGPVRELEVQGEKLQRHHCTPCRGH